MAATFVYSQLSSAIGSDIQTKAVIAFCVAQFLILTAVIELINTMSSNNSPRVANFLPASILLSVIGWGGLITLIISTLPTVGPRWLFFFLCVLAVTGTMMPIIAFLNRRFPSSPPPTAMVIVRQAMWFAVYVSTLIWLQMGRVLNPALAILLVVGLGLIEFLLRLSEKSQWKA
jgi:hypothetical protein